MSVKRLVVEGSILSKGRMGDHREWWSRSLKRGRHFELGDDGRSEGNGDQGP